MAYQVKLSDELAGLIGTTTGVIKLIGSNRSRGYYSSDLTNAEKNNHYLTCEHFSASASITITYNNHIDGISADEIYVNGNTPLGDNGYTLTARNWANSTDYCTLHYIPNDDPGGEEPDPENPPSTTITGEIRYYFDGERDSNLDSTYTANSDKKIYPANYILSIEGYTFSECKYDGTEVDSTSWIDVSDGEALKIYYITAVAQQSIQVCFVGNCRGIKILSADGTAITNDFLYEKPNVSNDQYYNVATTVVEGQELILQHKGYDTATYTWWELIGWYYGDINGNKIYIGDARAETFIVPAATQWNKVIYCEAVHHTNGITFKWDKAKKAGETFNVTAAEWIRLTRFIDAYYNDYTNRFTRSEVVAEKNFTAELFNQVAKALQLNIKVNPTDTIYASYFDDILKKVNNLYN